MPADHRLATVLDAQGVPGGAQLSRALRRTPTGVPRRLMKATGSAAASAVALVAVFVEIDVLQWDGKFNFRKMLSFIQQ